MFQALSTSWVAAVAIAVPLVLLFWWARRHAPVSTDRIDYTVGRHTQPTAEPAGHAGAPAAPAPHAAVEAPVPANPAALAPATEPAVPPASTVALPAHAPLPPAPATVDASVPAVKPDQHLAPPAPDMPAAAAPEPAVVSAPAAATPTPAVTKTPELSPEPPAPVAPAVAAPVAAAPSPGPAAAPAQPEPGPVKAAAPAPPAAAEPPRGPDDFTRLYGPDAAAIAALQAAGIQTYRDLAAANAVNLRQILADAGQPGLDPATWPQQARFAAGGKWKQLDSRFQPKA